MKKSEMKTYNDKVVSHEELEAICESEEVKKVTNCGNSGRHYGKTWYNVQFTDGEEIDVYQ